MSNHQFVRESVDNGIARITLCREPVNVMNIAMLEELCEAARWAVEQPAHLILIDAEGKAFSAGVDVGDHSEDSIKESSRLFEHFFEILGKTEKPVVTAVNGAALGGGCELAMAGDIILASQKAKFGQPEINVGAIAAIACYQLPLRVPRSIAYEMLLSGKPISAERAYEVGLVSAVFPVESFAADVASYLERYTSLSAHLLAKTKKSVLAAAGKNWDEGIAAVESIYAAEVTPSYDAKEGIAAFIEKRDPVWRHC